MMESLFRRTDLIKEKLILLSKTDRYFKLFGSERHKYNLNRVLPENEIVEFESAHFVRLPEEYRFFLQHIGDGGAGPNYGVEKLVNSLFEDLDYKNPNDKVNPSKPFRHTAAWNLSFEDFSDYEQFEKEYFAKEHSNGILRLCNFGCGVTINLVVNGTDYGNMWADDRGSDNGISPCIWRNKERLDFLTWYELWLDESCEKLKI